ncbi:MAG: hypothetical protein ABSD13_11650 [Candidatus Korobacteraceae bacterium]|jgi:hypothetical protein
MQLRGGFERTGWISDGYGSRSDLAEAVSDTDQRRGYMGVAMSMDEGEELRIQFAGATPSIAEV